ncbi:aspartate aminotransferase family protein [Nocardia pseudobrasiliensis]|uniref:Putrescine aminotransferase n=1 Tax=Nocardia pseudobrasiliensis TaxID=45979 RepID=A0A370IBP1_9NOCA|nr:aminotransferase class III-fold pyridoxal phosphate-dependent enzyme [Nocardia pseudobrasiliensis]RDI68142.1 putrescine aminotransferase [Nocardia pseudobrasiliensis]
MTELRIASDYDKIAATFQRNLSGGRARLASMLGGHVEVESNGAWLTTGDGQRFLNFGGYGVFLTGARHPTVVAEVERQLRTHPISTRLFLEPTLARAAEMLTAVTPDGLDRVHFCGSGAEAVETAIKLARLNGRQHLISMVGGYHGKTMGALSVNGRPVFQDPFRPLLPHVAHVPFGDTAALAAVLEQHPDEACVIVEPIQAEAGVLIPPEGYLRSVRSLCREYGALLVLDEVQTGLGRLGAWWGAEREGVCPDILLSGKGLGGGVMPVAAAVTTDELFAVLDRDPLLHTSTFSGAPITMAAVCGALRAIEEDALVERAAVLGELLLRETTRIAKTHLSHHGCEVRGAGLLIAVEIAEPGVAGELLLDLVNNDVVANLSMNSDYVLRLTPPAVLNDNDVEFFLERFEAAVRTTARGGSRQKG